MLMLNHLEVPVSTLAILEKQKYGQFYQPILVTLVCDLD